MDVTENKENVFVKRGILTALAYFTLYTTVVFIADHYMHLGGLVSQAAMQGSIAFYVAMAICMYPVERIFVKTEREGDKLIFSSTFLLSSLPLAFVNMLIGVKIVDRFFYIDEWRRGATAGLQFGMYGIGLVALFVAAVVVRSVISAFRNFGK